MTNVEMKLCTNEHVILIKKNMQKFCAFSLINLKVLSLICNNILFFLQVFLYIFKLGVTFEFCLIIRIRITITWYRKAQINKQSGKLD